MRAHLVEEGCARQHHGELARVVGVVEPRVVRRVPGVEAPGEADDALPRLPPHPATGRSTISWGSSVVKGPGKSVVRLGPVLVLDVDLSFCVPSEP